VSIDAPPLWTMLFFVAMLLAVALGPAVASRSWESNRHRLLVSVALGLPVSASGTEPVRLMTLDPGHFHAALIQKEMYPGVDPTVHVFAPVGADLLLHLGRVSARTCRGARC